MKIVKVKVKLHENEEKWLPEKGSSGASGYDLKARISEELSITPGEVVAIPTGVSLEIPEGYEGQIRPRSGLAKEYGVTVVNSPGTIDSDYRGEVIVLLGVVKHLSQSEYGYSDKVTTPINIPIEGKIAQLVIAPVTPVELEVVQSEDKLSETKRGKDRLGSTGV